MKSSTFPSTIRTQKAKDFAIMNREADALQGLPCYFGGSLGGIGVLEVINDNGIHQKIW